MDSWNWSLSSNGNFTTKKLSTLIDEKILSGYSRTNSETLKNYLVPNKLEIFIWRVLKRRLPVRIELDKRGIDLDSVRCPICDDDVESLDHLLFFCRVSMDVWDKVYKWWGLDAVTNLSISEAFRGKCNRNLSHLESLVWQAIEWTCASFIWRNRNQKVFTNSCWSVPVLMMEIQLKSFEWISNRIKDRKLDWLIWISDPCSSLARIRV
ncbi:uncharacterized protein [Rutidosis leptorrhynchoides]|uniref:uncharacterized protein n=1 Tax=Rutidosis leptorrhynchoides TaxID=125765 RepID=UPI003A99155A